MEEERSGISRIKKQTRGFCCYVALYLGQFEQNQEDEVESSKKVVEKMPMLAREHSSKIKFKNVEHNNNQPIYELLNELYENSDNSANVYSLLTNKRINPVIVGSQDRDDLEYYIPQIVTYMVLEQNLIDEELVAFILKGCSTDFFFAHRVYFYLKSLSMDHMSQKIVKVCEFLNGPFIKHMKIYERCKLSGIEFTKSMVLMDHDFKGKQRFSEEVEQYEHVRPLAVDTQITKQKQQLQRGSEDSDTDKYGTKDYPSPMPEEPKTIGKVHRKRYCQNGFMQTPKFWDDLFEIGQKVGKTPMIQRGDKLTQCLQDVNSKLPANIYVPFFKDQIRLYTILCIWKGRLFTTNTRAPYSIWVEMYRQEEELNLSKVEEIDEESEETSRKKGKKNILFKIYETISKPFSIAGEKNTLNIKKYITDKLSAIDESLSSVSSKSKKQLSKSFNERRYSMSEIYEEKVDQQSRSENKSIGSSIQSQNTEQEKPQLRLDDFFGANSQQHIQQVKNRSIYRDLKSWRLIHLMIKTGDDIKQEQFAMQLINRFQYIFRKEKIDCVVFPYEVISLGPDCGLIEMLNNVTTLNGLFEKINPRNMTLRQFFDKVYPNPAVAKKNFMRSLAGYSILTYFLQVKDRHNGNILLNRDGFIIHIDFGFFLTNAPGRGVEIEKKVPFKLLTEYVEVIGELKSQEFFQFRRLFYKGFSAILKHRESILTLVKMMYSSHGQSMACFIRGEDAIEELEGRFSIHNGVQSFCYDLISSSLDNWRAKFYDKAQYYLQKIYY